MATFDLKFSEERLSLLRVCRSLAELDVECCLAGIHKTNPKMVSETIQKKKRIPRRKKGKSHFSRRKTKQTSPRKRPKHNDEERKNENGKKVIEETGGETPKKKRVVHHHHHHHHHPHAHLKSPRKYPGKKRVEKRVGRNPTRKKNQRKKKMKRDFNTRTTATERDRTFAEIKENRIKRNRILNSDPNKLFRRKYYKRRIQRQNRKRRERQIMEESFTQTNIPLQVDLVRGTVETEEERKEGWDWERKLAVFHQLRQKLLEEKEVREHFNSHQNEDIIEDIEEQDVEEVSPSTSNRMIPMEDIIEVKATYDPPSKDEDNDEEKIEEPENNQVHENIQQYPETDQHVGNDEGPGGEAELYQEEVENLEEDEDEAFEEVSPSLNHKLSIIEKKNRVDEELEMFLRKRVVDKDGMYQDLLRLEEEQSEIRERFENLRDLGFSSLRSSMQTDVGDEENFDELDDDESVVLKVEDGVVLEEEEKHVIVEKRKKFIEFMKKNTNNLEMGKSSEIIEIVGERILDEIFDEVADEVFQKISVK